MRAISIRGQVHQCPPHCDRMHTWIWGIFLATLAKARELDPAACAPRFDVQKDKIIRTDESREMGARYLSELDVGNRQECLRLCCETDTCDVFVYEEKSPGSCYLFNCGPPEDFRCKFTTHNNFSSGVLIISRSLAELQDQERLTHHEQELANLRVVTSSTPSPTTTTVIIPTTHSTTPPKQTPKITRRCSRYQFECRTSGECIAVYNACDGIPQCADGSDEAPELKCPSAAPLGPIATTTTTPIPPVKDVVISGQNMAETPVANDRWPHRLTQAQQHRYTDNIPSSHIFSHKGGLLQDTDSNVVQAGLSGQYPPYEPTWQRRPWGPAATNMEGGGGDHMWVPNVYSPGGSGGYGGNGGGGGYGGGGGGVPYEWGETDPRRAWPVPQPRPDQEMPVYLSPKTMPETPMLYSTQQKTLRDSPKKGFDLGAKQTMNQVPPLIKPEVKDTKQTEEHSAAVSKKKELKVETTTSKPPLTEVVKPTGAAVHEHFTSMDDHDGLSEHPPAAVMLLILGLLMTSVMFVMVGCRARAARRRLRRGKSPFAHDADYLVNGMYL